MDGLEQELAGRVTVLRLDIRDDASRPFVEAHGVTAVPFFLLFDGAGQEKARMTVRVPSAEDVMRALE